MGGPERAGSARHRCSRARIEQLERTDRRDHDRQAHSTAKSLYRCVDLRDVAKHARPESDLVERQTVAAHGGLGLGGADDIVPGVLIQVRPRLRYELVKVLEFLAAGAEFN